MKHIQSLFICRADVIHSADIMKPGMFREMCKRIFNLVLSNGELAAIIKFFDTTNAGSLPCKPFLNHFVQLGIAERRKLVHASLEKMIKN